MTLGGVGWRTRRDALFLPHRYKRGCRGLKISPRAQIPYPMMTMTFSVTSISTDTVLCEQRRRGSRRRMMISIDSYNGDFTPSGDPGIKSAASTWVGRAVCLCFSKVMEERWRKESFSPLPSSPGSLRRFWSITRWKLGARPHRRW